MSSADNSPTYVLHVLLGLNHLVCCAYLTHELVLMDMLWRAMAHDAVFYAHG
jgi:hypothetical protein